MEDVCTTAAQIKAWSQNLGHENVATTLTSYGKIDPARQGELVGATMIEPIRDDDELLATIRALVAAKASG